MLALRVLGIFVAVGLLAIAVFAADLAWDDGRLFYLAAGRDALVDACAAPTRDALVRRGFTPVDLTFGARPSISFASGALGRSRVLSGPFTFSDGADGPRVDGQLVCAVRGQAVRVEVEVDATPLRAA